LQNQDEGSGGNEGGEEGSSLVVAVIYLDLVDWLGVNLQFPHAL